jgi:hypothetical protein
MTTAADDRAVEDAFEAYLAGRPVPDGGAALASFAGAVRATATQPGRPNAALAELLATGLLADQPSPPTRTARSAGAPPSRGTRNRNRRRFAMFFPALLAKLLSAGAVAQATAGAGIVVVVVTGAGVVGALPDPVQDPVATAIEAVTPLDVEGGEETGQVVDDGTGAVAGEVPTAAPTTTAPAEPTEAAAFDPVAWGAGPDTYPSFGAWVSAGAHNKGALEAAALEGQEGVPFGHLVRMWASKKHVDLAEVEVDGIGLEELIETTPTTAPEVAQETTAPAQPTASAETGRGNGNGKAAGTNGNSGNGGQGNARGNGRN